MGAGRDFSFGAQPDPLALHALGQLADDDGGTGEAALGTPALADGPGQRRLDGRGGFVDVVAVQTEPGFQAQGIAGAEARRPDLRLIEEQAGQALRLLGGDRDLESVLAGVPGTDDETRHVGQGQGRARHEQHVSARRRQARQHVHRRRPLQGEQCPVRQHLYFAPSADMGLEMGQVLFLARGVEDHEQVVAAVGHHQIVDDAAPVVGKNGVAGLADGQFLEVAGHEGLQGRGHVFTTQDDLAHVGDVEQRRVFTRMQVFGDNALVLHRHFVAGNRHHPGAPFAVQGVKRCLFEVSALDIVHAVLQQVRRHVRPGIIGRRMPPLSRNLKDSPARFRSGLHLR